MGKEQVDNGKISWKKDLHSVTEVDGVVERILSTKTKAVVVTGGEPTTYNLTYLTKKLKAEGIETFIETSGAYPLTGEWVIVLNPDEFAWAEETAKKVSKDCHLFLQPEWSKYEEIIPSVVEYVKLNQQWRISLQAHKFMHIP